jgi:hypothetical protein
MNGAIFWTIIIWIWALVGFLLSERNARLEDGVPQARLFACIVLALFGTAFVWMIWALTPSG